MKAVIVEDEYIAAQNLQQMLGSIIPEMEILTVLQTVDESVEWFTSHESPDLLFLDIHLADGSSFGIFERVDVRCPVIFTTAYDEYALKAFEVNSIDYLLKPINRKSLERALEKFRNLTATNSADNQHILELINSFRTKQKIYKINLLVPQKDKLIPLPVEKIACFFTENKIVYALMTDGRKFVLDSTLDDLYGQLNPEHFFRANRQFIVSRKAIVDISIWFGSKISVNVSVEVPERIIVSKARVSEFKQWFTQ